MSRSFTRILITLLVSLVWCFLISMVQPVIGGISINLADSAPAAETMAAYTETIPGTKISFDMAPITGGTFAMGSPETEAGRSANEGPQHQVTIRSFWIEKTEVTWDEYDQFAFAAGLDKPTQPATGAASMPGVDAITRPTPPYADESFGYGKVKHPVISITQHAAVEYCRWLSFKTGKPYRLPTEGEWEYACRAGSASAYPFGDSPNKLTDYAWYSDNSNERPHPVATKKPNAWGLYDMIGNVAEWCIDRYQADFYKTFAPRSITIGPVLLPNADRYPHVVRGGSWDDPAPLLRSAARLGSDNSWSRRDPQNPQSIWWHTEAVFVGFRVVRPLSEQENLKNFRSKITRESS